MNTITFILRQMLNFSIPLLIVAIGSMYSSRSGVINIGLDGIMIMGALTSFHFYSLYSGSDSGTAFIAVGNPGCHRYRDRIFPATCLCGHQFQRRSDHLRAGAEYVCPCILCVCSQDHLW